MLIGLVVFPTLYAYLNATLQDKIGDSALAIFFMLSLTLFLIRGRQHIAKIVILYFGIYLTWSIFNLQFAHYVSISWFGSSFF